MHHYGSYDDPVGSAFCSNCSAPFAATQNNGFAPSYEQPVQYNQNGAAYGQQNTGYYVPTVQKKKKKKLVWVLVAIIPVIIIIAIVGFIASSDTGSSPGWDYFMSTSGQHVIEFEGGFYYSGSPTTAKIQFVLDLDSGTFTAYHLSFDGESQSRMMLSALIEKAFESY